MAIFHCQMQKLTRGKGKSAVAAAAYRSGESFTNEYDGVTHNYSSRKDVVYSEIILPDNAPPGFLNRATLWNAVEKKEKSKNAVLAREFDIALPIELSRAEQIILIREYVKAVFVDDGMCADISIHDKNDGNPHAHVMLTCRPFSSEENKGDGVWGDKEKKNRKTDKDGNYIYDPKTKKYKCGKSIKLTTWDTFEFVPKCRERWAHFANQALERAGHDVRISHESLEAQGITDRKPQKHLGVSASAMERRGIETEIGNYNRYVEAEYHERLAQNISNIEESMRESKPTEVAVREVPAAPITPAAAGTKQKPSSQERHKPQPKTGVKKPTKESKLSKIKADIERLYQVQEKIREMLHGTKNKHGWVNAEDTINTIEWEIKQVPAWKPLKKANLLKRLGEKHEKLKALLEELRRDFGIKIAKDTGFSAVVDEVKKMYGKHGDGKISAKIDALEKEARRLRGEHDGGGAATVTRTPKTQAPPAPEPQHERHMNFDEKMQWAREQAREHNQRLAEDKMSETAKGKKRGGDAL